MTKSLKDKTLQEQVYENLKLGLLNGEFKPGVSVTIRGLAEELGVSAMPIREALRRLTTERALVLTPTGRVRVPCMTRKKLNQLVSARICLEKQAAIDAIPYIDDEMIEALSLLNDEIDQCIERNDYQAYLQKHRRFHFTLYQAAPSDVFMPLIESVWLQVSPFLSLTLSLEHLQSYNTNDRHVEIIQALGDRDATGLGFAIEADIRHGIGSLSEKDWPGGG
ncbi:MAG: FCD domain-containing protein [Gammaproteobacteria bacterium]|nr:FCD domain-containing protein [Gammaproteobacteria bacterium]